MDFESFRPKLKRSEEAAHSLDIKPRLERGRVCVTR